MNELKICEKKQCTGCGLCAENCPKKCIKMIESYDGFLYPSIDEEKCVDCNLCKNNCPNNKNFKKYKSEFFMAIHKDKHVLEQSSSGGAFTAIATMVLNENGIVFGAGYDEDKSELRHIAISSISDLDILRKSKYYQSYTSGVFSEVNRYLETGRKVLFSGTACQIAALYSVVKEKWIDNLITVDVLCHGVSNKRIVDSYLKSEEKIHGKKIIDYNFRIKNKEIGWKEGGGTKMKLWFDDGSSYIYTNEIDAFFLAFNNNIILRESCYNCKYCGVERISDYTIADFWGCTKMRASKEELTEGISLLVCNSPKAKKNIDEIKRYMKIIPIDSSEAVPYNKAFSMPNDRPTKRDDFFRMLNDDVDYIMITKKIFRKHYIKRIIKKTIAFKIYKWMKGKIDSKNE